MSYCREHYLLNNNMLKEWMEEFGDGYTIPKPNQCGIIVKIPKNLLEDEI